MRYSRGISNYLDKITLYDPTRMMSMVDLVAIGVKALIIDCECFLEKVH